MSGDLPAGPAGVDGLAPLVAAVAAVVAVLAVGVLGRKVGPAPVGASVRVRRRLSGRPGREAVRQPEDTDTRTDRVEERFHRLVGSPPSWFAHLGHDLALDAHVRVAWSAAVGTVVGLAALGWWSGGPAAAALAVGAGAGAASLAVWVLRGRRGRLVVNELPALLDAVAAALRAGSSLVDALEQAGPPLAGPLAGDLAALSAEVRAGAPLVDALERWASALSLPPVSMVVAVLVLGYRAGSGQAAAIDGVAATLRDRAAVTAELRALSAQARASAAVLVLAPVAFTAIAGVGDGASWRFLLGTPAGLGCLVTGLALDVGGAAWMVRITRLGR